MQNHPDFRAVALTAPAVRTVVVVVAAWNASPPNSPDEVSSDFGTFDVACSEAILPEHGIRWHVTIAPVLALRSVILSEIGGGRGNLPEVKDDVLFLDADEDGCVLALEDAQTDWTQRDNHMYRAFACHWPQAEDEDRLEGVIDALKYAVWARTWRKHHRDWAAQGRAAHGRTGGTKGKAQVTHAPPHITGPDTGRNGGGA